MELRGGTGKFSIQRTARFIASRLLLWKAGKNWKCMGTLAYPGWVAARLGNGRSSKAFEHDESFRRINVKLTKRWLVIFILAGVATAPCLAATPWVTLQGGHYLIKRPNDGDSFHVSVEGHEYIFRLYFVDAPETSAEFRDRVEEQAAYFGVTVDQVLQVGELAKQFIREKLTDSFLVRTCWEDAGGRSRMQRFYAFVQTRTGDLGEQLVENGLARAHPATAKPEGLTSAAAEWKNLIKLEHKAKREKVGGWGANEERMAIREQEPESERGVDRFAKFFHPAGEVSLRAAATPVATRGTTPLPFEETTPSGFPAQ